jgi:hypothetical protein
MDLLSALDLVEGPDAPARIDLTIGTLQLRGSVVYGERKDLRLALPGDDDQVLAQRDFALGDGRKVIVERIAQWIDELADAAERLAKRRGR